MKKKLYRSQTIIQPDTHIKVFYQEITPEIAVNFLTKNNYSKQRKIRTDSVDLYCDLINNNKFRKTSSIEFAILNNEKILINGQHTLSSIIKNNKSITLPIYEIPINNKSDLDNLYMTYDVQGKRSTRDLSTAFDLSKKMGLPQHKAAAMLPSIKEIYIRLLSGINNKKKLSQPVLMENSLQWKEEANLYFDAISNAASNIQVAFRRFPVFCIGLITLAEQPVIATEFWNQAALNDGLRRNDPRKVLHEFILTKVMNKGKTKLEYKSPYISKAVVLAWNSFYQNRKLTVLVSKDEYKPLIIAGTSFKSNQEKLNINKYLSIIKKKLI